MQQTDEPAEYTPPTPQADPRSDKYQLRVTEPGPLGGVTVFPFDESPDILELASELPLIKVEGHLDQQYTSVTININLVVHYAILPPPKDNSD